jgi:hypothetical protein
MSFRKKLAGIGEYDYQILLQLAAVIDYNESNSPSHKFVEIWETWEWLAFFQVNNGALTKEEFARLYAVLKRQPADFNYNYQNASEKDGLRLAGLHSDIQSLLRPHLSIAFLPDSYGSDIWPLTGKPLKRVKVSDGYGAILPEQIVNAAERRLFGVDDNCNTVEISYLLSTCFVEILKRSNDLDRRTRLGMRSSAYEILPWFLTFDLGKIKI